MTKYHISKSVQLLSIVLMFLCVQFVQSQNANSQTVEGTWLFNAQLSFAKIDKKADDNLKKNQQLRAKIQSAYTGKQITFLSNGSYSQVLANGKGTTGQWSVQGSNLTIEDPTGVKYSYSYKFLGNKLVISSTGKTANATSVMPNQYFTKI